MGLSGVRVNTGAVNRGRGLVPRDVNLGYRDAGDHAQVDGAGKARSSVPVARELHRRAGMNAAALRQIPGLRTNGACAVQIPDAS